MGFNFEARSLIIGAIVLLILVLGLGAWVIGRQASRLARVVATPLAISSPIPSPTPTAYPSPAPAVSPVPSSSPVSTYKPKKSFSTTNQTIIIHSASTPVPFKVTSVTSYNSPGAFSGSCPQTFTYYGTIAANGAGSVTYRWVRSDGSKGDDKALDFAYASSQNIEPESHSYGGSTSGWEQLEVTSPNNIESNQTPFRLSCY